MPRGHNQHLIVETFAADADDPRTFVEQDLSGQVLLDGGTFEACRFKDAALVYIGGVPPTLRNCSFDHVSFEFKGAAGRTVSFLQTMSAPKSGFSPVFKSTFPKMFGH